MTPRTISSGRHRARRPRRRRALASLAALAAGVALIATLQVPGAEGAFLAKVANAKNTAQTNAYFTCTGAAVGETATRAYSAYPLGEASGTTATDVSGNGHNGTYSLLGLTRAVAGPCPRDAGKATTFDGVTGYVYDPTGVAVSPEQSDEVWFRTTTTNGGLMISSFSVGNPVLGGGADRVLYMTTSGQVAFGVYDLSATRVIYSPSAYNDGNWHEAQGVLSNSAGTSLYIDGALVAANASYTQANNGFTTYTHIANGQLTGWGNIGPGALAVAWQGTLAYGAIYRYPLTALQAAQHYAAGR